MINRHSHTAVVDSRLLENKIMQKFIWNFPIIRVIQTSVLKKCKKIIEEGLHTIIKENYSLILNLK